MNSLTRQYLFGGIFIAVGIYMATMGDMLEFTLYSVAGTAFVLNALTLEPRLFSYKKILVVLTWIFITASGLLFLYLLQFKYF